jgi:hypothetical protein
VRGLGQHTLLGIVVGNVRFRALYWASLRLMWATFINGSRKVPTFCTFLDLGYKLNKTGSLYFTISEFVLNRTSYFIHKCWGVRTVKGISNMAASSAEIHPVWEQYSGIVVK